MQTVHLTERRECVGDARGPELLGGDVGMGQAAEDGERLSAIFHLMHAIQTGLEPCKRPPAPPFFCEGPPC